MNVLQNYLFLKGSESEIVEASLNHSPLWQNFKKLKLKINMRVNSLSGEDRIKCEEFANFLLSVGEGREQTYEDLQGNQDCI